jgi:DNA repair exonuclease SbcCD nuclease subunit
LIVLRRELIIGDPHAVPEELDDCQKLMDFALGIAAETGASILTLGDQYHSHNVIRAEVMSFWKSFYRKAIKAGVKVRSMVGNHDYSGEHSKIHSLMAHTDECEVIDRPTWHDGVLYMPYYANRGQFIEDTWVSGTKTLVCHQTFVGSHYENGSEAPDGVDAGATPQEAIISGHLHTPQSFGKVTYIGAPRWRTLSDANIQRAMWLYEFDDAGSIVGRTAFDTGTVCRQIKSLVDSPDFPVDEALDAGCDWRIDIKGPPDWVERRKKELAGPGVRIRTFITAKAAPVIRESEGIAIAFATYTSKYKPKYGTSSETLTSLAKERLGV